MSYERPKGLLWPAINHLGRSMNTGAKFALIRLLRLKPREMPLPSEFGQHDKLLLTGSRQFIQAMLTRLSGMESELAGRGMGLEIEIAIARDPKYNDPLGDDVYQAVVRAGNTPLGLLAAERGALEPGLSEDVEAPDFF